MVVVRFRSGTIQIASRDEQELRQLVDRVSAALSAAPDAPQFSGPIQAFPEPEQRGTTVHIILVVVPEAPRSQASVEGPYLTIEEAAQLLKVGDDTVERLVASGQLKASEFSGKGRSAGRKFKRIRREALEAFLTANELASHPSPTARRRHSSEQEDFIG